MIEKEHLSWLLTVPATDQNFKSHLNQANNETIAEALTKENHPKNKILAMERELRKRRREFKKQ